MFWDGKRVKAASNDKRHDFYKEQVKDENYETVHLGSAELDEIKTIVPLLNRNQKLMADVKEIVSLMNENEEINKTVHIYL